MSHDLIARLKATSAERARATATDDPNNYLVVVARVSHEDADLMAEAAAELTRLRAKVDAADKLAGRLRDYFEAAIDHDQVDAALSAYEGARE